MTAPATEEATPRVNVEEQARIVMALLKEYVDKLVALNADALDAMCDFGGPQAARRAAWLLDQGQVIRTRLPALISCGSGLLEHAKLTLLTKDELTLRMSEIDIHFHHSLRVIHELRQMVEAEGLAEQVAKLRYAAGLNAMKGGPLRPAE